MLGEFEAGPGAPFAPRRGCTVLPLLAGLLAGLLVGIAYARRADAQIIYREQLLARRAEASAEAARRDARRALRVGHEMAATPSAAACAHAAARARRARKGAR